MSVVKITDEDIEQVEEKFDLVFDDESKDFIKCLESKDIKACPGAGKTTSLVAKLDILSNNMPFSDNSGVLVLTHTNVAVDEIKKKLGINVKTLLSYPNHVGTFQSFINKFLAIPMYIKHIGSKPERIDSEIFYKKFEDILKSYHRSVYGWLSTIGSSRNVNAITVYQKLTLNDSKDKFFYNNQGYPILTLEKKRGFFNTIKTIKERDIESELICNGYLTYSHCYDLALDYLETNSNIKKIFQKRFKYIFVDEAQDTDDRQFSILDSLFNEESIIQKIGDNNQAIFNFSGQKVAGWNVVDDFIEIKNTKRLSTLISNQVIKVAQEPQELNGNESITIQPTIIIFDNPENVINIFSELVIEHDLHTLQKKCFKAIGGVGKENENGDTLINYYSNYQSNVRSCLEYDTLLDKLNNLEVVNFQLNDYRKIILNIVKKYIKDEDIENFTSYSLISFIQKNNEQLYTNFKLQLFQITKKLYSKVCIRSELEELLQMVLNLFDKSLNNTNLSNIIKNYKIDVKNEVNKNIYQYVNGDIGIDIEVSTVHKAKGETHTATLVLETFNNGYDLYQLLKLLQGRKFAGANINKKKLLYVGMSRATHFLCLAIHKEQKRGKEITDKDIELLESAGFRIVYEPI